MSITPEGSVGVPESRDDPRGIIFNIQRYSIQDGPGIRTTVFLKGCPLRCQWCSNPESQNACPEVAHRDSLCSGCGRCIDSCPQRAISLNGKNVSINRAVCNNCGGCVEACMTGCLEMLGRQMSVEEVFAQVKKDAEFYRN